MHQTDHGRFRHSHDFVHDFSRAEKRTRVVIVITFVMMLLEITAGVISHSMALLADGWHMSTHAIAFMMAALAYYFTRRHASNARFSFGTGKIGVLGGFSSAIVLSVIALAMAGESVHRLFSPLTIHFNEAIGIAVLGLCVNLVSAFLLKDDPHHHHAHDGSSEAGHTHHRDLNLRAAYIHVLADAFTSVLAISALTADTITIKFDAGLTQSPVSPAGLSVLRSGSLSRMLRGEASGQFHVGCRPASDRRRRLGHGRPGVGHAGSAGRRRRRRLRVGPGRGRVGARGRGERRAHQLSEAV